MSTHRPSDRLGYEELGDDIRNLVSSDLVNEVDDAD